MNVRHILYSSVFAITGTVALTGCDMMKEDLSDCPTGLYVNFAYDYNIDREEVFKDNVRGLSLYVFDEDERLVVERQVSGSQLAQDGYPVHFTEQELAPDHRYRLVAVALQKPWAEALATPGAKYRTSTLSVGDPISSLYVTLDHPAAARAAGSVFSDRVAETTRAASPVSTTAPLDTLWHTLTTVATAAPTSPRGLVSYGLDRDGQPQTNGSDFVELTAGEPTYATVAMIRDTKHLNITLRALNDDPDDNQVADTTYTVEIIDNNAQVDYLNRLSSPEDTLVYRPYRQWTTTFVGNDQVASESAAHYDLMFNRLVYRNASVANDQYAVLDPDAMSKAQNALLLIKKAANDSIVFGINLPYILSSGRTWTERAYHYQEYLDREYDYRLQFILRGGRVEDIQLFIGVDVHTVPWAVRTQHVEW